MQNMYVGELCLLLHKLKIAQHDIAAALRVERTAVGAWGGGKRPIPARHIAAFKVLVGEAIAQAEKRAWIGYRATGTTLLNSTSTVSELELMVRTQLRRWKYEMFLQSGQLAQQAAALQQNIAFVSCTPAHPWGPDEYAHLRFLANELAALCRIHRYVTEGVNAVDGHHIGWEARGSLHEAFHRVWAHVVAGQGAGSAEEDATGE
jgi:hypothetical protein